MSWWEVGNKSVILSLPFSCYRAGHCLYQQSQQAAYRNNMGRGSGRSPSAAACKCPYISTLIIVARLESQILYLNNSQRNKILVDCSAPSENKVRRKVETPVQLTWKDAVALQVHCLHRVSSFCHCWRAPVLLTLLLSHT